MAVFPLVQPGRDSMLWQADSDFWFRMAGGSIGPGLQGIAPLESDQSEPVAWELNYLYDVGRPTMARLLAYAALHHVGRVLSLEAAGYPSAAQMRRFGPVQRLGGMLVAPACGRPPLTARDLTPYVRAYDEELRSGAEIGYCDGVNYRSLPVGLYPAGALATARPASFVAGRGLTCEAPPAGYVRRGFATADMGVRGEHLSAVRPARRGRVSRSWYGRRGCACAPPGPIGSAARPAERVTERGNACSAPRSASRPRRGPSRWPCRRSSRSASSQRRRSSAGISIWYPLVLLVGFVLWVGYGLASHDLPLVVPNIARVRGDGLHGRDDPALPLDGTRHFGTCPGSDPGRPCASAAGMSVRDVSGV